MLTFDKIALRIHITPVQSSNVEECDDSPEGSMQQLSSEREEAVGEKPLKDLPALMALVLEWGERKTQTSKNVKLYPARIK